MSPTPEDRGIVLVCDSGGVISEIIRDDLGLTPRVPAGTHVSELVDSAENDKIAAFLAELQIRQAAMDWEIGVPVQGVALPLHFAGALIDSGYLIMAAHSRSGMAHDLYEELMRINNGRSHGHRSTVKYSTLAMNPGAAPDHGAFEELSRLNNEMANFQRELARKNAELDALNRRLVDATRELASPLGLIGDYAGFLETDSADGLNDEQRGFVTLIRETAAGLVRQFGELLESTGAAEPGSLNLHLQPVDLTRLIRNDVALSRNLAADSKIALEFGPAAALPPLTLDAGRIHQLFAHLIGNAIRVSPTGSRVTVSLRRDPDQVTVAVRNQSQGTSPDASARGLDPARQIVEAHGGQIRLESEVDGATTVCCSLPVV